MAQRRQIRVSRSLEGEGERPARRYGVAPSRIGRVPARQAEACPTNRAQKQTGPHGWLAVRACVVKFRRYLLSRLWHYHRLWKLNYRVRDGNGCDLPDMFTGNIESPPSRRMTLCYRSRDNECCVVVVGMSPNRLWQFRNTRYEWSSVRPLVPVS